MNLARVLAVATISLGLSSLAFAADLPGEPEPTALTIPQMFRDMKLEGAPCRDAGPEYLAMAFRGIRPRSGPPKPGGKIPEHARRYGAALRCVENFGKSLRYVTPDTGDKELMQATDILVKKGALGPLFAAFQIYSSTELASSAPAPAAAPTPSRPSANQKDPHLVPEGGLPAQELSFSGKVTQVSPDGEANTGMVFVESDMTGPQGKVHFTVMVTSSTEFSLGAFEPVVTIHSLSPGSRVHVRALDHGLEGIGWTPTVEAVEIVIQPGS